MTLNDIDPTDTDPFVFRDIYPDVDEIPNGAMVAIPAFEITPIFKSFTFDDFSSADFSQGFLELTITNSMVIPIGSPIVIELLQVTLGDTINLPGASFQFDDIIDANNGSSTGVIDLANINSCCFILTGDKGIQNNEGQFQVLGRWNPINLRGCNFLIDQD